MQGFRSFHSAWRTIQGIETVHMIRKGQIRWLATNQSNDFIARHPVQWTGARLSSWLENDKMVTHPTESVTGQQQSSATLYLHLILKRGGLSRLQPRCNWWVRLSLDCLADAQNRTRA
jgi:hypothetical protein